MRLARRLPSLATLLLLGVCGAGCAHTVVVSVPIVDMDRARSGPDVKDGALLAPQEFAHAEEERALSNKAAAAGDATSADLHAERAVVAYERAVVLARLARATDAEAAARLKLAEEEANVQRLVAAKVPFETEAGVLANDLAIAREAVSPVHVGPADAAREKARLVAARSLAAEAHLLCGAAKLLTRGTTPAADDADAALLATAEQGEAAVEASFAQPAKPKATAPIDAAARARADCLNALTHERRATGGANSGDADALLSTLSSHGGWDPSRDERGVVVTLHGAFKGTALASEAEKQLRDLGHVAAAHGTFPLQIVVHDATTPDKTETTADTARAQAALAALTAGGASGAQAATETVGARLPKTDPNDPATRGYNARLEVVFVSRND
jgi:hypothetical protein